MTWPATKVGVPPIAGAWRAPITGGIVIDVAGYRVAFLLGVGGIALAWRAPEHGTSR